jgi:hypothetical protein
MKAQHIIDVLKDVFYYVSSSYIIPFSLRVNNLNCEIRLYPSRNLKYLTQ